MDGDSRDCPSEKWNAIKFRLYYHIAVCMYVCMALIKWNIVTHLINFENCMSRVWFVYDRQGRSV